MATLGSVNHGPFDPRALEFDMGMLPELMLPEIRPPLDNGRHHLPPKFALGALVALPLELMTEILVHVDLRSLTNFRLVNRRATLVVDSIREYRTIGKEDPALLRRMLRVETGSWFTCRDVFHMICNSKCELCGGDGNQVCLLTCRRRCFPCIFKSPACPPLIPPEVGETYDHDIIVLSLPPQTPHRTRANRNSSSKLEEVIHRLTLALRGSIRQAGIKADELTAVGTFNEPADSIESVKLEKYEWTYLYPKAPGDREIPGYDQSSPSIWMHFHKMPPSPRRFIAIMRAPWVKSTDRSVKHTDHNWSSRRLSMLRASIQDTSGDCTQRREFTRTRNHRQLGPYRQSSEAPYYPPPYYEDDTDMED